MGYRFSPADQRDIELLSQYLERAPRGLVAIGARCECGNPLVAATAPLVDGKTPFPTVFYLAHPALVRAVSRVEATGVMEELSALVGRDAQLGEAMAEAHRDYLAARAHIADLAGVTDPPQLAGISAGGLPTRVKCLHAMVGHSLAAGPGVNPIGDWTLRLIDAASCLYARAHARACACARAQETAGLAHGLPAEFREALAAGRLA